MENRTEEMRGYDFRLHDRIWERVSPELAPFPELRSREAALAPRNTAAELQLPGAEADPCCLGSAAAESLPVLEGFLGEERQTMRLLRALLCAAPTQGAARTVEKLLKSSHAILRRISAVCYLIEGRWPCREETCLRSGSVRWQEGLRIAYHLEACGALNYTRAGEETTDPCLSRLLQDLGQEKYARADRILNLLAETKRG